MIVYADVLVVLNIIVTYFILLATQKLSHVSAKIYKLALASFVGGMSSLYIFLPQQNFLLELFIKLLFSAVITIVAFGAASIKRYIRCVFSFYAVSFLYAGFMLGFWYVLRPAGMAINNGIVYFSVSPIVLILSTVVCYIVISVAQHFYRRNDSNSEIIEVTINRSGSEFLLRCMVDSGNTVNDPLGNAKVIIIGKKQAENIFGAQIADDALSLQPKANLQDFRLLPYKTVMGEGIMPALAVGSASANGAKFNNVILGIIRDNFGDFDGIISPSFFD